MEQTFQDGDLLFIRKGWLVKPTGIKRNDIVVVQLQDNVSSYLAVQILQWLIYNGLPVWRTGV